MVALVFGSRLKSRQVRARARLAEALAPLKITFDYGGDVLLLLRFRAVFQQGGAEHHHAHAADRVVGPGAVQLLLHHPGFAARQAAAAIGRGPGRHTPALLAHRLAPGFLVGGEFRALLAHHRVRRALQRRREIRLDPAPGFRPERLEVGPSKISHRNKSPEKSDL
jgi:hypothetical protein